VAAWQALHRLLTRLGGALGRAVLAVFVWILAAALWTLVAFR
jgi:hypothetical protein